MNHNKQVAYAVERMLLSLLAEIGPSAIPDTERERVEAIANEMYRSLLVCNDAQRSSDFITNMARNALKALAHQEKDVTHA